MGRYLDALTEQFDEITAGMDKVLDRAADEGRELNKEEIELVDRDKAKAEELKKSIDHYSELEVTRSKVAEVRGRVPQGPRQTTTTVIERDRRDPEQAVQAMFPTVGHYMIAAGRAMRGDQEAQKVIARAADLLEPVDDVFMRATAHQTLADNPGLVPRPLLGPIVTLVDNDRPFINSVARKPLPAGSFDRMKISQHVGVGKQAKEKDLTESRQLKVDKLPVAADTLAGHLNISRQDIKWTNPGIMQLVAEDFGHEYAMESDEDAVVKFLASVTANTPQPIATWDGPTIRKALFTAAGMPLGRGEPLGFPNTFWMSIDIWAELGGLVSNNGTPFFPGLEPGTIGGNVAGFKAVVDPWFPAGTAVLGKGSLVEYYEDIDGLIQVSEPDVLGQLVGYAGFEAELNTAPQTFTVLQFPAIAEGADMVADAQAAATAKTSAK